MPLPAMLTDMASAGLNSRQPVASSQRQTPEPVMLTATSPLALSYQPRVL
jgi:hypothetical protein